MAPQIGVKSVPKCVWIYLLASKKSASIISAPLVKGVSPLPPFKAAMTLPVTGQVPEAKPEGLSQFLITPLQHKAPSMRVTLNAKIIVMFISTYIYYIPMHKQRRWRKVKETTD